MDLGAARVVVKRQRPTLVSSFLTQVAEHLLHRELAHTPRRRYDYLPFRCYHFHQVFHHAAHHLRLANARDLDLSGHSGGLIRSRKRLAVLSLRCCSSQDSHFIC